LFFDLELLKQQQIWFLIKLLVFRLKNLLWLGLII